MTSYPWQPAAVRDVSHVGPLLRRRRQQLGLRLEDVGDRAGAFYTHIGRLERGDSSPQLATVITVAEAVGLELQLCEPRPADTVTEHLAGLADQLAQLRAVLSWDSMRVLQRRAREEGAARDAAENRVAELQAANAALAAENEALRRRKDSTSARAEARELKAQNRRYRDVLDALARQPVLTHDLIDEARSAADGVPHTGSGVAA